MSIDRINFSTNWNECKLSLRSFTTIRLLQPDKYVIGREYEIWLKDVPCFRARIIDIKPFLVNQLTEFMARLDTGYSGAETIAILRKMYPNVDFERQQLAFILLLNEGTHFNKQTELF